MRETHKTIIPDDQELVSTPGDNEFGSVSQAENNLERLSMAARKGKALTGPGKKTRRYVPERRKQTPHGIEA